MTEFLIGLLIVTPFLFGAGSLLRVEWNKIRCAQRTFVAARKALILASENRIVPNTPEVETRIDPEGVTAFGSCDGVRQEIRLLHLEKADFR